MAKYKDAEEIASVLDKYENYIDIGEETPLFVTIIECVKAVISAVPAVDAVEVVRCKDCKYHKERGWYNICDIHVGNGYPDNWFCADGEPKDGDT